MLSDLKAYLLSCPNLSATYLNLGTLGEYLAISSIISIFLHLSLEPIFLIPKILDCIENRKSIPVYGKGDQVREWIWVEDRDWETPKLLQVLVIKYGKL